MMVEKVPDSTYEMVGGLDKQIKEIKEVWLLIVKQTPAPFMKAFSEKDLHSLLRIPLLLAINEVPSINAKPNFVLFKFAFSLFYW